MTKRNMKFFALLASIMMVALVFQNCQPYEVESATNASSSGGDPGNDPDGSNSLPLAEKFFVENVRVAFQARCNACHAEPRFVTGTPATLAIYNYSQVKLLLAAGGTSITNNNLIRKVSDMIPHTGGNFCSFGLSLNDPVCGLLIQWHQKEYPSMVAGLTGQLNQVAPSGRITGWALNPTNPAAKVRVYFYMDGPVGSGVALGNVLANIVDVGAYSGNYYSFQIPSQYIDNRTHQLYMYLGDAVASNLSPETPLNYGAYVRTVAGNNYFNTNILPTINSQCNNCHTMNIDLAFTNLIIPTPANNGTASTNNLITNARGSEHPFNGCNGGINSGLCAAIQQWWAIQFQ